jgi:hypothetical protein
MEKNSTNRFLYCNKGETTFSYTIRWRKENKFTGSICIYVDLDQHHICKTIKLLYNLNFIYECLNYLSVFDTYDLFIKNCIHVHIYVELPYSSAIDRHYILA